MYSQFVKSFVFALTFSLSIATSIRPAFAETQLMESAPGSVYRFYNVESAKHVMMMDYEEANNLYKYNKAWKYDGVVFMAFQYDKVMQVCKTEPSNLSTNDIQPVYRFYNPIAKTHFFAIGSEVAAVERNVSWIKEGVVFCAVNHNVINTGLSDTFRFYYPGVVSHVFTADNTESDIIKRKPQYIYEGIPFKVFKKNAIWGSTTYDNFLSRSDAKVIEKSIEDKFLTVLNLGDIAHVIEMSWDFYPREKIMELFAKADAMIQTEKLQIASIVDTPETIPLKGAVLSVAIFADEYFTALKGLYNTGKMGNGLDNSIYAKRAVVEQNLMLQLNIFKDIYDL